jgi:hypothetical protein
MVWRDVVRALAEPDAFEQSRRDRKRAEMPFAHRKRILSVGRLQLRDPAVRASFQKTMSGNFDNANGGPFSPLELFVMELFRVISPNGGSISAIKDARTSAYGASPQQRFGFPMERHTGGVRASS